MRRDGGEVGPPRVDLALADARLGAVVDDDAQRRMALDDAREVRQVPRQHERVEDEVVRDIASNDAACDGRSSHASSPMSCTIGRSPTSFGSRASAAIASGASLASKSAQPTTPSHERRAVREVEEPARLGERRRGLNEDVRSMPCRARIGARSAGPKSRWMAASDGVSHP